MLNISITLENKNIKTIIWIYLCGNLRHIFPWLKIVVDAFFFGFFNSIHVIGT